MSALIKKNLIFVNCSFTNRDEILSFLANKAEAAGFVKDKQAYQQAVLAREEEISTAIGYDLAIPHGKSDTVETAFILFMRLQKPIRWTKENEHEVRMIFMLGIPSEGSEDMHLRILAKISRNLMHDDFREQLLNSNDSEGIYELLNGIEF